MSPGFGSGYIKSRLTCGYVEGVPLDATFAWGMSVIPRMADFPRTDAEHRDFVNDYYSVFARFFTPSNIANYCITPHIDKRLPLASWSNTPPEVPLLREKALESLETLLKANNLKEGVDYLLVDCDGWKVKAIVKLGEKRHEDRILVCGFRQ